MAYDPHHWNEMYARKDLLPCPFAAMMPSRSRKAIRSENIELGVVTRIVTFIRIRGHVMTLKKRLRGGRFGEHRRKDDVD